MNGVKKALAALDGAVYQVERVLLFISLAMMTVLVSIDVIQRTFSRPVGRTDSFILLLAGDRGPEFRDAVVRLWGPLFFGALSLAFLVFAAHSARLNIAERANAPKPGLGRSAAVGVATWVGAALFIKGVLWLFPSSLPGAQKFALGFMLWAGLLGASLATHSRRHIVLDAVKKKLDPQIARPFALLSSLMTVLFTGYVGFLGVLQVKEQIHDWMSGPGIGVYESVPVPYWAVSLAIPVTFFVISARFLAQGIHDLLYGPPAQAGPDSHGVDLEALGREAAEEGHGG